MKSDKTQIKFFGNHFRKVPTFFSSHIFFLIFLNLFAGFFYLKTLLPGMGFVWGDSAKFQYLGKVLGIPHPTGYPLYLMLTWFWGKIIFWGNQAYKINLFSAFCALVAVSCCYGICWKIFKSKGFALLAALLFAFTATFWSQAIIAEVYTLHTAFMAAVIFCFFSWAEDKKKFWYQLGCFLYALSFGNHLTAILLLPAIFYWVMVTDRKNPFKPKNLLLVSLWILIGMLQYSYLFIAYANHPPYAEFAVRNWDNFFYIISGGEYKDQMFSFGWSEFRANRLPMVEKFIKREFTKFLTGIGLFGIGYFSPQKNQTQSFLPDLFSFFFSLSPEL